MNKRQIEELLIQALETERGGIQVYTTAITCAVNEELREEWKKYLEETKTHESILTGVFAQMALDTEKETPGRSIVRAKGEALVAAMKSARAYDSKEAAQIVACECVVDAETKDHQNWELIGEVGKKLKGEDGKALKAAYDQVEDQEDEHLYHTAGWTRELWIESLGMPAVIPPPEEEKDVKSAIGAARAKHKREEMLAAR